MTIKLTEQHHLGAGHRPYIIAEIGSNHNGDMELARKLIKAAKDAGADCVKFQSWSKDSIFSRKTYDDNYFLADDYRNRDDFTLEQIVDKYAITEQQLKDMAHYARELDIDCTSTPFSRQEADFLIEELDSPFIKVASMDLNNYPFLDYLAKFQRPMILSTGLSSLAEIDTAVSTIEQAGNRQICLLHCVAIYPPKDEQINLLNIKTLQATYPYPIGFSDHSIGTSIPVAAMGLGACLIEKHFTLDKNMEGWDHKVSADAADMQVISDAAVRVHQALGSPRIQRVEATERLHAFRRSVVAAKDIKAGEVITADSLDCKRPGSGLPPESLPFIIGKAARRDIKFDEILNMADF